MLTTSVVVLVLCVAVSAHGPVFSENTDKKTIEETAQDIYAVLDQVLDELKYLRDEDKRNKEEIKYLKNEGQKNKEENRMNKDEIHSLKAEDKKNKDRIDNLTGQTTISPGAAFMANMNEADFFPDKGDVILFSSILLNVGQNYDDQTSVFTCAESGLYLFSVTLYSNALRIGSGYYDRMSGALMLDGVNVAEVYSATGEPDLYHFHQSAVMAVVECPKGGSVWVECQYSNGRIYGTDTRPTSVFTGFAITYNIHP